MNENENESVSEIKFSEEPKEQKEQVSVKTSAPGNALSVPVAIIVAGALIAGAVLLKGGDGAQKPANTEKTQSLEQALKISKNDHIKGNPNAKVVIIEYSDFECPFCKRFHETMNQVMDEYGDAGEVAWVYRHFPLDQLHPVKARKEAVATECATELGGNDAFWKYADRLFELTLSNNQTNVDTVLPQISQELGLNQKSFQDCLVSGKYDQHIENDIQNAILTGGQGTPWSILVTKDGKKFPINGAQPYSSVKSLIDAVLK